MINYKYKHLFILIIIPLLFVLPLILSKSLILGSDAIFHFNRFYETALQIKNHNLNYFISMYGYQESGRIILPLYGPIFSYIQGILVLITPTWFFYQIISNYILYLVSEINMYFLLKKLDVSVKRRLYYSIFYLTTYSIQYWTIRQGFSSWGAAFLPLFIIPIVTLFKYKKFNYIKIALSVACMVQIHLFSALILVIIYIILYVYYYLKFNISLKKWLIEGILSITTFFLITINFWYAMYSIYTENNILSPFINNNMHNNTITSNSYYWLINPIILLLMIFLLPILIYKYKRTTLTTGLLIISILFFTLSTNLIPWKYLINLDLSIINIIQFPFRFFIPFTIIFLILFCIYMDLTLKSPKIELIMVSISIIQTLFMIVSATNNWKNNDTYVNSNHIYILSNDNNKVRDAFFIKNKQKALNLIQKSTPDYIPLYSKTDTNKYDLYYDNVIINNHNYKKTIKQNSIILTANNKQTKEQILPLFIYKNSNFFINNKKIDNSSLKLTDIGNPILKIDKNTKIKLTYSYPKYFKMTFYIQYIILFFILIYYIQSWIKRIFS